MDERDKLRLIDEFEKAYDQIKSTIAAMAPAAMSFVPAAPTDAWPIRDHLVHLLDADMMLWYRARVCVAEPGAAVPLWDQERWRSTLSYESLDPGAALSLAEGVRSALATGFKALVASDWSGYYMMHPDRGRMGLFDVLSLYRDHVGVHLAYIERNLKAFKEKR